VGYFTLFRVRGVPIRVHASLAPLLLIVGCVSPVGAAAYLLLLVTHELGHALAVRAVGARVARLDFAAFHGLCHFVGSLSPIRHSIVAFAGVWAQLALVGAELGAEHWFGARWPASVRDPLGLVLVVFNLGMIVINLFPIESLDGAEAWKLFPRWFARAQRKRIVADVLRSAKQEPKREPPRYLN
jgi:hypothetical protein